MSTFEPTNKTAVSVSRLKSSLLWPCRMPSSTNDDNDGVSCLCGDAINYKGNQRNKTLYRLAGCQELFCLFECGVAFIINRNHSKISISIKQEVLFWRFEMFLDPRLNYVILFKLFENQTKKSHFPLILYELSCH